MEMRCFRLSDSTGISRGILPGIGPPPWIGPLSNFAVIAHFSESETDPNAMTCYNTGIVRYCGPSSSAASPTRLSDQFHSEVGLISSHFQLGAGNSMEIHTFD